jgi:hypothetical protein
MSAFDIAKSHFEAALAESRAAGYGADAVTRYMLSLIVSKNLETRSIDDVRSELMFIAENCDPDADFMFMRP